MAPSKAIFLNIEKKIGKVFRDTSNLLRHEKRSILLLLFFFLQIFASYIYAKTTSEGKEARNAMKGNIFTDFFPGSDPPGNLMKWFNLRL